LEVIFMTEATQGVRTLAVKGDYTPREALDQLLAGTPLTATQSGPTGAFKVRRESEAEAKNVSRAIAETEKSGRPAKNQSDDTYANAQGEQVLKLPEYMVTGTKTLNADIKRTRDDAQPYVVFESEVIQRSGSQTIEDYLKSRLPMNAAQTTVDQDVSPGGLNYGRINLRGLGANQTLVLVDGRRIPGIATVDGVRGQPNIMVYRHRQLSESRFFHHGFCIYGGGATGGVVNVILRRNYSGSEIGLTYGSTFKNDASIFRIDLNAGLTLLNGRTHVTLTGSHSEGRPLLAARRDFSTKARDLILANNPSLLLSEFGLISSTTSNVVSTSLGSFEPDTRNLILKNGTPLNAPSTFVPIGYAGPSSDAGAAFVANAGRRNYNMPDFGKALYGRLRMTP